MRSKNCTQTNRWAPLASLTECYKLVTLISKDSSSFSSTDYGNFTHNLQTGNFLCYNPYTKDTTKTKQTPHPTEQVAVTATCARPSDARIATAASLFIGVLFCCAQRLQISRTLAELHWILRRRPHDHAATCSSAARNQRQAL